MRLVSILWSRRRVILGTAALTVSISLVYGFFAVRIYGAAVTVDLRMECEHCGQIPICIHSCPKAADYDYEAMLRDFLFPYPQSMHSSGPLSIQMPSNRLAGATVE
jgi:ferredoxin